MYIKRTMHEMYRLVKMGRRKDTDYRNYRFTRRELLTYLVIYLALDGAVSYLFFSSVASFIILLPGAVFFFKDRRSVLAQRRRGEMQTEFLTGMQLVSTCLQAGYAIENAFKEAAKELKKIYEEDAFIIREFSYINSQIGLNRTIEALLLDLGERSGVEDIRNFSEVFSTAKRTGGDLMAIIQNTVSSIQQKQETKQEIATCLSGKKMEQSMMSGIPLFILAYVRFSSPGFLDAMYHNLVGITVMIICLIIYLLAFIWGRRIMHIEV